MRTSAQALEGTLPQQPCDQVLGICRESLIPFWPHNFICKEKGTAVWGGWNGLDTSGKQESPSGGAAGEGPPKVGSQSLRSLLTVQTSVTGRNEASPV